MALETGSVVNDLVATNPTASDAKSQGDDHLRLIKTAVKNSFPGFTGAVIVGGTSTGAVNAYVLSAAMQSYVANTLVVWTPSITNTDATTININGLGYVAIKRVDGAPTLLNDLIAGQYAVMAYTGTEFRIVGVTKSYIDSLSFASSLPAQTGNAGKVITTDGTSASWTNTLTLEGLDLVAPLAVAQGGTSSNNATSARAALSAAKSGANADITALSGLTTALSVAQGGTGTTLITGTGSTVHSTSPTISSPTLTSPTLGTPVSGNLTNCTFPTLNQNTTGSSGSCTGNAATATTAAACSGNAATATTAGSCSGNAATATTAGSCSGNAATATNAENVDGISTLSGNTLTLGEFNYSSQNAVIYFSATNVNDSVIFQNIVDNSLNIRNDSTGPIKVGGTVGAVLAKSTTAWGTYSDERVKDIIEPITNAITKVNSLRAVIGKYKTDDSQYRRSFLIAQDVQNVLPEAVSADDDEIGTLSLRYTEVIPLLVAAIKEQQEQINQLKTLAGI